MMRIGVVVCLAGMVLGGCSKPTSQAWQDGMQRYDQSWGPQLAAAPTAEPADPKVRCDAANTGSTWLATSERMAQHETQLAQAGPSGEATSRATTGALRTPEGYIPWQQRRGPAYSHDFWTSLGRYGKEFPETLWDDTKATVTNPVSLVALGMAGAAGIALHGSNADKPVADHYTRHGSQLNSFWDTVGDVGGNPGTHFAVTGAWFLSSLAMEDTENYEKASTMLHALALNGIVTEVLKVCANTRSPNGDTFAWPSGHTSSSFTFATVIYKEYGPWVGIPFFAFASYVGYERVDARNHNFSDVISGALIGIAIGHAVAENHKNRMFGMTLMPYVDPQRGGVGLALGKEW
jgi:hypothetical protein